MSSVGSAASDIQTVELVLTAGCNLSCSYCYQNAKQSASMSWGNMQPALDLLLRSCRRQLHVIFHGGEPLLKLALIERAVDYAEGSLPLGKRIRYSVTTNGILLSSKVVAFLAANHFDTQLSFDGVPPAQERRHPGTFERVEEALDRARREQPPFFRDDLAVAITLTNVNLPLLGDSVDYLLRKGVRRIRVSPLITPDPTWRVEKIEELDRQWSRVFQSSLRHYRETGRVPVELLRRTERGTEPERPREKMCGIGGDNGITVDVDGKVNGCAIFAESYQTFDSPVARAAMKEVRIGHVTDVDLSRRVLAYRKRIDALELFGDPRHDYSGYRRCRDCRHVDSCSVCPSSIGRIPHNTDPHRVPDHICAFNLVTCRYRDKFPRQKSRLRILLESAAAVKGGEPRFL